MLISDNSMKAEPKKTEETYEEAFDRGGWPDTQRRIFRTTSEQQRYTAAADPWVCVWVRRREDPAWLPYKVLSISPYRNHLIANQYATLPLHKLGGARSDAFRVGPWSFDLSRHTHTHTFYVFLHETLSLVRDLVQDKIITESRCKPR